MELVRSSIPIVSGLPCEKVRSAPAIVVSGPAQRLLTLWPACSRSRLATLSIENSDSFVAFTIVSIATGWSEPVPGRELHPLKSSAFHGALFHQLWIEADESISGYLLDNHAPCIPTGFPEGAFRTVNLVVGSIVQSDSDFVQGTELSEHKNV